MEIVISDTNIFIDLWNIGLLERFCELPLSIHTTDFIIGELKAQGVKDAIAQLHQEGKITIKTFKSNDKQTIRRLDGNEYATLRLLCFWLGCWLRWDFNIICLFICRCSFYFNRDNSILGMLLEPRIELLVWNTLVNTKGIN